MRALINRIADWYIFRIDYGRNPQPRVMEWLYIKANNYNDRYYARRL